MALLFLNLAVFGALFTLCGLVRIRRFRRLAYPVMLMGLTTELGPWRLAVEAAVTAVFWAGGTFATPAGRLGLWITFGSWAGQALSIAVAMRAPATLRRGFAAAGLDGPARVVARRRLWRPWRQDADGIEIVRDIAYGPHPTRNLLDLYRRIDETGPRPIAVQIHGGSWLSGRKHTQQQPAVRELARQGWLVACITYRRGGDHRLPEHIDDVRAAIAWLRAHAGEEGGDPACVVLFGGSAGAHLAALAALTVDPPVQGCAPIYGTFDLADRHRARGRWSLRGFLTAMVMPRAIAAQDPWWDELSPITKVHPDAPPFLVIHGRNDVMLFREESDVFVEALRKCATRPVVAVTLPGAQHAFDYFWSIRTAATVDALVAFATHTHRSGSGFRRSSAGIPNQNNPGGSP